ncbi:MAG: hypothetical protein CL885_03205 [Dehalococcoidia bacterium]|nr:hypothetical protein [Dehalococcoidia bacterium]
MLPLFKSHYSIGKSILTLAHPDDSIEGGPSSVFEIAKRNNLDKIVFVEDSLIGFLEAKKISESLGIQMVFGLRINICDDIKIKDDKSCQMCVHKIVIFAKNSKGCQLLNKIYSYAFTQGAGKIDFNILKTFYDKDCLKIAIPFYDSFLFNNSFSYSEPCMLDDSFFEPTYFIEDNHLPFDSILSGLISNYCYENSFEIEHVKSIYYENRDDFEAYQTYKCICSRGFGKAKTLDMPNLDHCGSPEFCFESYLDNESA